MAGFEKFLRKIRKSLDKRLYILRLIRTKGFDIRFLTGCDIKADLPDLLTRKVRFPHPVGIVISAYVKIGDETSILQNVTIGVKKAVTEHEGNYPVIGRNVTIFAGAVIMGSVEIGDHCLVGANAVVNRSFPPYSIIAGAPARRIGTVPMPRE